jgi:lipooligosaccharide transport system ATP-binding protein
MDEAEQLCDRLVVMDGGLIVAEGAPAGLIERYSTREVLELRFPPGEAPSLDDLAPHVERVEALPDRLLVYTADGERAQAAVAQAGHRPLSALVRRSSLEDVFLRLTGRSLVE